MDRRLTEKELTMNNTIQMFKDQLRCQLNEAERENRYFRQRGQNDMADINFGRADALRKVIDWANILED